MGIGYKLTDTGKEFVESGNTTRDLITKLESQDNKTQVEHLSRLETERQDKELDLKSKIASIISKNEARWFGIIGILFTIGLFVIDKCGTP